MTNKNADSKTYVCIEISKFLHKSSTLCSTRETVRHSYTTGPIHTS